MGRLIHGSGKVPAELASYDPDLWEGRVMASNWAEKERHNWAGLRYADDARVARHVAYYLPSEAANLYRDAVEKLRLPSDVEHRLIMAAIHASLHRAVTAQEN